MDSPPLMHKADMIRDAKRVVPIVLCAVALWPVWLWLLSRYFAPNASPLPVIMLVLALGGWAMHYRAQRFDDDTHSGMLYGSSAVFLMAVAFTQGRAPGLLTATLGLAAFACVLLAGLSPERRRHAWALFPILLLAAPLGPSFDFFLGYPLRLIVARIAALVALHGIHAEGTGLSDGSILVYVDAPCSGIRMFLTALAVSAIAAGLCRLPLWATIVQMCCATVMILLANVLRVLILFRFGDAAAPDTFLHEAVGIVVFTGTIFLIFIAALGFSRMAAVMQDYPFIAKWNLKRDTAPSRRIMAAVMLFFVIAAMGTFTESFFNATPRPSRPAAMPEFKWPTHWKNELLHPVPSDAMLEAFLNSLPGAAAQFRLGDSGTLVLLRICSGPTRTLHPAEHCYTATGWRCQPKEMHFDHGYYWSSFHATHPNGQTRLVRQAYFHINSDTPARQDLEEWIQNAPSWPDASGWFWATARINAPVVQTLAITVAE
jgi:exosortase/archaeosortase family protein